MDAAESFVNQRLLWRVKAARDLEVKCEPARDVLIGMRASCALISTSASGVNWSSIRNAEYVVGLAASFLRTQLTILDLAEQSEIQDGATLLRKNLETIARILELEDVADAQTLFKRPPNVRVLKGNAAKLYGGYSEIAHSAHPQTAQLLGGPEDGRPGLVSMHPKFGEHTLVLISNAFVVFGEFYAWARYVVSLVAPAYPREEVDRIVAVAMQAHEETLEHIDALRNE